MKRRKCTYKWLSCDWWRAVLIVRQLGVISCVLASTMSSSCLTLQCIYGVNQFCWWNIYGTHFLCSGETHSVMRTAYNIHLRRGDSKTGHVSISAQQAFVRAKDKERDREWETESGKRRGRGWQSTCAIALKWQHLSVMEL